MACRQAFRCWLVLLVLAVVLAGLRPTAVAQVRPGAGPSIADAQAERYDGPKARIAVADFEDKMSSSGHYRAEYGRGMADMLATALFNTNRFIVLERQKLGYVLAEQDLGASGRMKRETAAPIGELEGAELLVAAAVTGFDPGVAGGGGGMGGAVGGLLGRRAGQAVGAVAGGFRRAHLALDLRVIDTKTGRVVAANSVEGSATEFGGSLGVASTSFGGALGGFAKTPMERAIREAIQASVDAVVANTPRTYYRVAAGTHSAPPVPELQSRPPAAAPEPASAPPAPAAAEAAPPQAAPPQVASVPPATPAARPTLMVIALDRNPRLTAELNEVRRRGAVISVTLTVRNPGDKKEWFNLTEQSFLLDYSDGKQYPATVLPTKGALGLEPRQHMVLRATFKAPPDADTVAIVLDGIGTFDDVELSK